MQYSGGRKQCSDHSGRLSSNAERPTVSYTNILLLHEWMTDYFTLDFPAVICQYGIYRHLFVVC